MADCWQEANRGDTKEDKDERGEGKRKLLSVNDLREYFRASRYRGYRGYRCSSGVILGVSGSRVTATIHCTGRRCLVYSSVHMQSLMQTVHIKAVVCHEI